MKQVCESLYFLAIFVTRRCDDPSSAGKPEIKGLLYASLTLMYNQEPMYLLSIVS